MRLDNAATVFLAEWPAEGVSKDTIRAYRSALSWLCGFATARGSQLITDLSPALLRAAMAEKMDSTRLMGRSSNFKGGEAAASQVACAARALARWARAQGLPVDDLTSVKLPRVPERIQPRLYPDEFQALESTILRRLIDGRKRMPHAAVSRDLAILNVLAETGLRAEEFCRLQLGDIDFEHGWLTVRRGKGKKDRVLAIVGPEDDHDPLRVVRLLGDWLDARRELRRSTGHQYLWTSVRGHPLQPPELRHVLARICLEAGLPSNRPPHAFRRYVFTEHYRQRPDSIRRLAARMGWSEKSHKMLDTYTRGAEMDFGRDPMPLLSGGLRNSPKVPITRLPARPMTVNGVGPPSAVTLNGRAAPRLPGKEADSGRQPNRTKRPAPLDYADRV